jgi:ariadne-1
VISDGATCITIKCPAYGCKLRISSAIVLSLCGEEPYTRYMKWLTRDFVRTSNFMRWCPAVGCENVAIGTGNDNILCLCNYSFCTKCNEESHLPATCEQMVQWSEKNDINTASLLEIRRITQCCPKCLSPIEKNDGCLCMTCRCGQRFCWVCRSDWATHGDHFTCNKYNIRKSDMKSHLDIPTESKDSLSTDEAR